jgi:hypothetical protein
MTLSIRLVEWMFGVTAILIVALVVVMFALDSRPSQRARRRRYKQRREAWQAREAARKLYER